jgi:hypothetical protein
MDKSQEVIPQHSGFGCGSAALDSIEFIAAKSGFSGKRLYTEQPIV